MHGQMRYNRSISYTEVITPGERHHSHPLKARQINQARLFKPVFGLRAFLWLKRMRSQGVYFFVQTE
jgi:hypothetical protein